MNPVRAANLTAVLALAALCAAGCGGSGDCAAGAIQSCSCADAGGGTGLQSCVVDGGWNGCTCGLSNDYCGVCKEVVADMYDCLDGGWAQTLVDGCFESVCGGYDDAGTKDFCEIFSSIHATQMMQLARSKTSVDRVCSMTGYCTLYPTAAR